VTPLKTYSHLQPLKRKPTEYDIVASKLLYYVGRDFEVNVPITDWYRRCQSGSGFVCSDWELFRDPRETTYTKYTELQKRKEIYVDGLLDSIDETGYDEKLPEAWVRTLSHLLGPVRYPVHGLQMAAAYVGQMAPSGRITIAALCQTADEVRRVQRLAYRMRQLQRLVPAFGSDSKALWQDDGHWQPLREGIEKLLVTYDWGEAFVALNLVLKPFFDELFLIWLGRVAEGAGDPLLACILGSLNEDATWHRDWSRSLVRTAVADRAENAGVLLTWQEGWHPIASRAVSALAPLFEGNPDVRCAGVPAQIEASYRAFWSSLGVSI